MKLLSRDVFRATVLAGNGGRCREGSCTDRAVDAHHILNRNLFTGESEFGGYFVANGAGLCSKHHLLAEATVITCDELYRNCQIPERALPLAFDRALSYDTWGNVVVSQTERRPGPLFETEGCQKMLRKYGLLWQFSAHIVHRSRF